jgi:Asp-tRNA(Asn)/Glu-tRNA(Gln) amidotransferase B subunit
MIQRSRKQVEKFKQNPKLLGFFVGKALSETQGKAKPELVSAIMLSLLAEK